MFSFTFGEKLGLRTSFGEEHGLERDRKGRKEAIQEAVAVEPGGLG